MGTKNNPGEFDCYETAEDDEPMFILLGRDPFAPMLIELWHKLRKHAGDDPRKLAEAADCAAEMRAWLTKIGRTEAYTPISFDSSFISKLSYLKGREDGD